MTNETAREGDGGEIAADLRTAFDSDDVPGKNIALRKAADALTAIQYELAAKDDEAVRWKANAQSGWAALHLIREALTERCIPGTLASDEQADGPTQQHEAEQLIAAISALKEDNARLRRLVSEAFKEGRESTFGTDRHRADRAWENSHARAALGKGGE